MNYQSPITMYTDQIIKDIVEKQDEYLMEKVRKVGFDINKEELAKALKYDRDQYMRGYTDGRMYKPPIITNEDKIRYMTREELAVFLKNIRLLHGGCPTNDSCIGDCDECWLKWLKQEVDEE